jgi:eukaryotic-like serine/threonine-protein kinase
MATTRRKEELTPELSLEMEEMEEMEEVGESSEETVDPLVGTVIAERYRIDRKLGEGGMGAVYKGEHVLMQKPVAIKVLHREMTVMGEVVKRFEREAIAAGRIDHPNVATATDFGKLDDGSFFLVLEYVPGKPLADVIAAEGALGSDRALSIGRQVAAALSAAHAAGIVHRDLKPDNVMLIEKGGMADFVKVLDFGIAKLDASGGKALTQVGSVFGTPQYMSPEQAQGKTVDARADLYALGLVIYEMLAGHPTFESEELVGLLTAQMVQPPPPLPASVDPAVSALVMKLLEKDPGARIQTATELVDTIDAMIGPMVPPPESGLVPSLPGGRAAFGSVARAQLGSAGQVELEGLERTEPPPTSPSASLSTMTARLSDVALTRVDVAGRRLPLWAVGGAAVVLVVFGFVVFGGGGVDPAQASKEAPEEPREEAPRTPALGLVENGQRDAMNRLLEKPESERSFEEWRALARGHDKRGETLEALGAYRKAALLDAKIASDRRLLRLVRQAFESEKTRDLALGMAADDLGEPGADLLFEAWSSTSERTPLTTAAKALLDTSKVQKHASAALRVALDLRSARSCGDYKKLLPAAKADGDERSLKPLQKLVRDKGCGFLDLSDCYPCLRGSADLSEALRAVQSRNAPRLY